MRHAPLILKVEDRSRPKVLDRRAVVGAGRLPRAPESTKLDLPVIHCDLSCPSRDLRGSPVNTTKLSLRLRHDT